jgi:hypothetical protein
MNSNRNRKGMGPKWAEATHKKHLKGMYYTQLLTHLTLLFLITSLAFMRAS